MKDERGFGLVGLLALLPFLISLLALIKGGALLLRTDAHLKQECRASILNSQRTIAEDLRALIALNSRASELRSERVVAEAEMRAAEIEASPPMMALAETRLVIVKVAQAALAAQQRVIILRAKALSLKAAISARRAVSASLADEARANGLSVPGVVPRAKPGFFDVVASPAGDPTPDYNPSPKFSVKQTVDVNVEIDVSSLLPEWLRSLLPTRALTVNTHCEGTIEEQEHKWTETLSAAR